MNLTSKNVIAHYQKMAHWLRGLENISVCWRASDIGLEYTAEEQNKMHEAGKHLEIAAKLATEVYSAMIGTLVTREIRSGSFKGLK